MYIASTAAESAILANYIAARQLHQLATANTDPVRAAYSKQLRSNPPQSPFTRSDLADRKAAMERGCDYLWEQVLIYSAQALALGLITWDEYKQATRH